MVWYTTRSGPPPEAAKQTAPTKIPTSKLTDWPPVSNGSTMPKTAAASSFFKPGDVATEPATRQPSAVADVIKSAAAPIPPATVTVISGSKVRFERDMDGVWRQVKVPVDTGGPAATPVTITPPIANASAAATPTWTLWDSQYEEEGCRTATPFTLDGISPAIIVKLPPPASVTGPGKITPPSSESSATSVTAPEPEEVATADDNNTPASVAETSDRNDEDNSDEQFYDAVEKLAVVDDKASTVKPSIVNKTTLVKPAISKRTMMRCATARPAVVQPTLINNRNRFAVLESLPQEGQQRSRSATKKKRTGTRRRRAQRAVDPETTKNEVQPRLDEETQACLDEGAEPPVEDGRCSVDTEAVDHEVHPHPDEETKPRLDDEVQPPLEDCRCPVDAEVVEREVQRRMEEEIQHLEKEMRRRVKDEMRRLDEDEAKIRIKQEIRRRVNDEVTPRLREELQRRLKEEMQSLLEEMQRLPEEEFQPLQKEETQRLLEEEVHRQFGQLSQYGQ